MRIALAFAIAGLVAIGALVLTLSDPAPSPPGEVPSFTQQTTADETRALPVPSRDDPPDPISPKSDEPDVTGHAETKSRTPRSMELTLTVLAQDDAPIAGARVALYRSEVVLDDGETNASGVVSLEWDGEVARVGVARDDFAPWQAEVLAGEPRQTLHLPECCRISGTVTVGGSLPDRTIEIRVEGSPDLMPEAEWPTSLGSALGYPDRDVRGLTVTTDPQGRFAVPHVPTYWSGRLRFPYELEVKSVSQPGLLNPSSSRTVSLKAPVEDLRIDLHAWPQLVGRVVSAGDRSPVPDIPIAGKAIIEAGRNQTLMDSRTDEEGRFSFPLSEESYDGFQIIFWTKGNRTVDVSAEEMESQLLTSDVVDVGDIELSATREIDIVVRNRESEPIANAHAGGVGFSAAMESPTNREGEASISGLPLEAAEIEVAALRYRTRRVEVPPEPESPFPIELERGAGLVVVVRSAAVAPSLLEVVLEAERGPFLGNVERGYYPPGIEIATGSSSMIGAQGGRDGSRTVFAPDGEGRVLIGNLDPALPLTLKLQDRLGSSLAEHSVSPLGPTEWRTVELTARGEPFAIQGRVLDDRGQPIAGAGVALAPPGDEFHRHTERVGTDPDGRFALEDVFAEVLEITVRKRGYARLRLPEYHPTRQGTPLELRMRPGHDVTLRVEDTTGRLQHAWVSAIAGDDSAGDDSEPVSGEYDGEGAYVFQDLPPGRVTLRARIGTRRFEQSHDTDRPEAVLVVPVSSELEVVCLRPLSPQSWYRIELQSARPSDEVVRQNLDVEADPPTAVFSDVFEGSYRLTLQARSARPPADSWESVGPAETVDVPAGSGRLSVELGE